MKIQSENSRLNFTAKFLHSESLQRIAEYSVEHNKFEELNQARKNIDKTYLRTKFLVDIGDNDGKPFVTITSFAPKKHIIIPHSMEDYRLIKTIKYASEKRQNVLKFALQKIIKIGNSAPNNNAFQRLCGKK